MSLEVEVSFRMLRLCTQLVAPCFIDVQSSKEVKSCNNLNVINFQYHILHILVDSYSNEVKTYFPMSCYPSNWM